MSTASMTREVAYRVFADEFDTATYTYAESDDERAPQYLVTPAGARLNRVFVVGVLTETEEVSDGVIRARIADPTGVFVCYAGQYQPDALAFFERADPPLFVAITGKARTFQPEGAEVIYSSLRPERVNEVDADTRDNWVAQTAQQTLERTGIMAQALGTELRGDALRDRLRSSGVPPELAAGIPRAIEEYGTTRGYLAAIQEQALDAVKVITGSAEEAPPVAIDPGEDGPGNVLTGFTTVSLDQDPSEASGGMREEAVATAQGQKGAPIDPESVEDDFEEVDSTGEPTPTAGERGDESSEEPEEAKEDGPSRKDSGSTKDPARTDPPAQDSDPAVLGLDLEEDDLYELTDEERKEVEENFDVEFESGATIERSDESAPGDETGLDQDDSTPDDDETGLDQDDSTLDAIETS
ncbi:MAG: RPA family protein, partial [Halodesulfurarchaeum sp.]